MSIFTPRSLRRVELQIHLTSPDHVAVRSDALEEDLFVLESDRHLLVASRTPQTDAGCAFHSLGQEMGRTSRRVQDNHSAFGRGIHAREPPSSRNS
jgi:hypothetical protein